MTDQARTDEALRAIIAEQTKQLAAMKAELDKAKAVPARKISLKVGEKGTVCLYHGGRYPVSLYASQWRRVLPFLKSGEIEAFMDANASLLASELG